MATDTFQEATARSRVSVRIAWEDVTQIKKRKITAPCESRIGICKAPWVTSRIMSGISNVVKNPVVQVSRENSIFSIACPVWGNAGSCRAL